MTNIEIQKKEHILKGRYKQIKLDINKTQTTCAKKEKEREKHGRMDERRQENVWA